MPRSILASRALAVLAVGVVALLASLQAINTEAGGDDDPMLRELSQKVARVAAAGGGAIVTSSGTYQLQSTLTSEPAASQPSTASQSEPSGAAPEPQVNVVVVSPSPTPEPSPAPAGGPCSPDAAGGPFCLYTVQDGDTLWGIAEQLGFEGNGHFSGAELLAMSNGLNNAQNWIIVPGQELRVPSSNSVVHTVEEAQTISQLAELYGSTTEEVTLANPALNPNNVIAGSEVLIPSPSLWPVFGPVVLDEAEAETESEDAQEDGAEEGPIESGDGASDEADPESEEPPTEAQPTGEGDPEGEEPQDDEAEEVEATEDGEESSQEDGTPDDGSSEDGASEEGDAEAEMERSSRSSGAANPSVPEIKDQFAAGYIAAGGPPQHLERILAKVIPCESGYNLRAYNPAGPFYGLMQFLPETWARVGGGDWADAWQQGHNTGRLLLQSSPTSQWPHCWR